MPTMLAMCGGLIGVGIVFIGSPVAVSEAATAVEQQLPHERKRWPRSISERGWGEVTAGNDFGHCSRVDVRHLDRALLDDYAVHHREAPRSLRGWPP